MAVVAAHLAIRDIGEPFTLDGSQTLFRIQREGHGVKVWVRVWPVGSDRCFDFAEAWLSDRDVRLDIDGDYRLAGWETPTIVADLKRIIRDAYDADEEAHG